MRAFAFSLAMMSSLARADVPTPPLTPQTVNTAAGVANALQNKDVSSYEHLLAPNLEVVIDGNKVALTRDAWMRDFRSKLITTGVYYFVDKVLAGP